MAGKKISEFDVGQYVAEHQQYLAGIRENGIDPDTGDALPIDNVKFPISDFASSSRVDGVEAKIYEGLPAWDENKTYAINNSCYYQDENHPYKIYRNLTGNNTSTNPAEDLDNWAIASSSSGGGGGAGAGGQIFDVVQKDHSLSFEESKGLVELGGYAYKEGVPDSRYGYPDFYNECLQQYQDSTSETLVVGSDTITIRRHSNGHLFYNISDKAVIDNLYTRDGSAWLYGIDTTYERIYLPRQKHGKILKSHYSNDEYCRIYEDGWCEQGGIITGWNARENTGSIDLLEPMDSSYYIKIQPNSNRGAATDWNFATGTHIIDSEHFGYSVYGYGSSDITTGMHWEVKGYVANYSDYRKYYMICGTVEEEVAMTEVTEVTTSENDTIPLFTHKFFELKPNHISWVPANTIQSGNVYVSAYNNLVSCLTYNPYEINVIDEADEEVGVDYSEYWIVNQTNQTFRTPIKVKEKLLTGKIKGDGKALGLTDGTTNKGMAIGFGEGLADRENAYGQVLPYTISGSDGWGADVAVGITTDPDNSGIIAEEANALLYFKVANAVQNLQLIDAGRIEESKADINASNFNQTGKETIVGWGIPDLTRGVSKSAGSQDNPNIAQTDCVVVFAGHSVNGNGSGVQLKVYDGTNWVIVGGAWGIHLDDLHHVGAFYLSKGTQYCVYSAVFDYCIEYPLKGV